MSAITPQFFIRLCILASIAFLPMAHLKLTVFGVPLYSVEIPVVVAVMMYLYGWREGIFSPTVGLRSLGFIAAGATLFFLGAALSFASNPFSLTGLGMLKSWFVFPMLAAWLWREVRPDTRDHIRALQVWFTVTVAIASVGIILFVLGERTYDNRLAAWYVSPNYLAFFLAPAVLIGTAFLMRPFLDYRYRAFVLAGLFILAGAIFFTKSYATWAGVFAVLGLFLLLRKTHISRYARGAALCLLLSTALAFILFESGSAKWQSLVMLHERSSLASREMIWQAAARIIVDHPVTGIGVGRFQEEYLAYQRYFPPYLEWAAPQPHNLYLAVWLQTGIAGLIGFLFVLAVWFRNMFAAWRAHHGDEEARGVTSLLMATLLLYLVVGLVDTPFFKTDLAYIFWLTLSFGVTLWQRKSAPMERLG